MKTWRVMHKSNMDLLNDIASLHLEHSLPLSLMCIGPDGLYRRSFYYRVAALFWILIPSLFNTNTFWNWLDGGLAAWNRRKI